MRAAQQHKQKLLGNGPAAESGTNKEPVLQSLQQHLYKMLSCFVLLLVWSTWLLEKQWGWRVCVCVCHSIVSTTISATRRTCAKINCVSICWKRPMKCRHGKSDGRTDGQNKAIIEMDIALIQFAAIGPAKCNVTLQSFAPFWVLPPETWWSIWHGINVMYLCVQ